MKKFLLAAVASLGFSGLVTAPVAHAQTLLYTNGAINGTINGWSFDNGAWETTDSFSLTSGATAMNATIGVLTDPGATLLSLDWAITTSPFGGTTLASGSASVSDVFDFNNSTLGVDVGADSFSINPTALPAGTYWLQLSGGIAPDGGNMFWDENDGPSLAEQQSQGGGNLTYPGSESFQLYGTVPEPASLALFGVGLCGLRLVRRRRA